MTRFAVVASMLDRLSVAGSQDAIEGVLRVHAPSAILPRRWPHTNDSEEGSPAFRESEPGEYEWQDRRSEAVNTLADMIQAEHEENTPTVSGVFADLLNAALSEVDWREIAQHYVDDIALELEAEEAKEAAESEEATS